MRLIVRQPTLDELPKLSELCLRSKAVWGYDQAFIDACRDELTLHPSDLAQTHIAVVEDSNGMAGVAQISAREHEADLLKLFVDPSMLRKGIGKFLFSWACEQARNMRASRLFIEADPDAAQFYRRMGAYDIGFAPSGSIRGRKLPRLAFDLC